MDLLKKYFPRAFKVSDVASLIIAILIYIVFDVVAGAVIGLLAAIPVLGIIFSILGALVGIYATAGIVISVLVFCKVLK